MPFKNPEKKDSTSWSENEIKLINHVEIFQEKPVILKKVENRLLELQKSLEKEILPMASALPDDLNLTKNQDF